jgi:hypothetical protein
MKKINIIRMKRKKIGPALAGLLLLWTACEKDVSAGDSGPQVIVNFAIDHAGYETKEEVTRRFDSEGWKPETVVIPLGNEWYLYATLTPDAAVERPSNELRASLAEGQKVCLAAYATGNTTTPVATGNYKVVGGALKPDGAPLGVEPGTYYFAAYSYYDGTADYPATTDIDPTSDDLIWARTQKTITMDDRTVVLAMAHQFSRVRVQVDASSISDAEITALSDVAIEGGKKANLAVGTGAVTATGTAVTATFPTTGWTTTTATRLSPYRVFYPSLTKVTVGSMSIKINSAAAQTFTNLSATFTQTLAAGVNYKVMVDVRENRWAHSNIYWESTLNSGTGGLMFDKTPMSHSDYQGVYFKFGSLVGIAPTNEVDPLLYIPPVGGGNWISTHTISTDDHGLWPSAGTMPAIPYIATGASASNAAAENYLYNMGSAVFGSYTGDICSYLTGGDWRLPNAAEFGSFGADYDRVFSDGPVPNNPAGKGLLGNAGVTYRSAYGRVFFPATGERQSDNATGSVQNPGRIGWYWSGSAGYLDATMSGAMLLSFSSGFGLIGAADPNRLRGFAARCIKTLSTD